jgi:hypothetical protein
MDRQRASRNLEDDDDEHLDGVVLLMLTSLVFIEVPGVPFSGPSPGCNDLLCLPVLDPRRRASKPGPSDVSHLASASSMCVCEYVCVCVQMRGEEDIQHQSRPQEHQNRQRYLAETHIRTGHPVGTHSCVDLGKTASHHSRTLRQAEGPARSVPHLRACLGAVTRHSNPIQTVFPGVA